VTARRDGVQLRAAAAAPAEESQNMKARLRDNGLSIVLLLAFLFMEIGLSFVGQHDHNAALADHGEPPLSYVQYVRSAAFMEATMENWESEFLQMFAFVFLTVFLYQRGSAESKSPDREEAVDRDPRTVVPGPDAPGPVRRGGWVLRVYENSLSLALLLLFVVSFALHAVSGAREYSREALLHGGEAVGTWAYLGSARFWFESLQNWQSEFFSIAAMVVLSVYLRQRGSPESKPVHTPHHEAASD
jgi:hypothetical protein